MTTVVQRGEYPPSYQDVAEKITEKYLNYNNGFFIEVGGADGITQSNTFNLEVFKNWSGILVEPNPKSAKICSDNRVKSSVFNYALVSDDFEESEIKMVRRVVYNGDPGLMTSTADSPIRQVSDWINPITDSDTSEEFIVQTTTLNSILETQDVKTIDFFSLDVEGYELEVLRGLDLKKYCPKVILVEWHLDIEDVKKLLDETHEFKEQLSKHDYVFIARN
jgi:FkbM family methyltransferase